MTAEHSSEEGGEGLSEAERTVLWVAMPDDVTGAQERLMYGAVERILADRLAVTQAERLCSQCGERMSAMLKIGTTDGWCTDCLDEAADTTERDDLRGRLAAAVAKWSGCWCDTQMAWDHDPRVQDCPQHGDASCRHMAEGIVVDLRAALTNPSAAQGEGEGKSLPVVWHVVAHGGRSVDRVCDSLPTGQSVCDDLLDQLGGKFDVVEDWTNLNVTEAPERWVRYISRNGGEPFEQSVAEVRVDTSGTWFRENAPAPEADQ